MHDYITSLVLRAQVGDTRAWTQIEQRFMGMAVSTARRYFFQGADAGDVRLEAHYAMWRAVRDYKPGAGMCWTQFLIMAVKRHVITHLVRRTRLKYSALNNATSLDQIWSDGGEGGDEPLDLADTQFVADAEAERALTAVLDRADLAERIDAARPVLSAMEQALIDGLVAMGDYHGYSQIAQQVGLRDTKSVDNTLLRVRAKCQHVVEASSGEYEWRPTEEAMANHKYATLWRKLNRD